MTEFWDRLGISASLLCILHCALTPAFIIFIPYLGHSLAHEWVHWASVLVIVPVAFIALLRGYKRHHQKRVLWLGGAGLLLITLAMTAGKSNFDLEVPFMIAAGALLTAAHWFNLRVCRRLH